MKKLIFALALVATVACGCGGSTAAGGGAKIKYVAVVETEVEEQSDVAAKLNKAEVREITAVLRNEARNSLPPNKYKIMTAETVIAQGSAVLEECAEENCVIALGSRIGADYIVRGAVSTFGDKLTLSIVMYETEDGTLVASARVSSEKADDLLEKATAACGEMYRKFENPRSAAQKAPPQQQTPTPAPVTYNAPVAPPPPPPAPPQPVAAAPQPTYQPPAQTYQPPAPVPAPAPPPASAYQQQATLDGSGLLTDGRDGTRYKTVVIGGKRWMGENLNYQPQTGESWCYDNDNSNCGKYGRLYDWNTARTVCPSGWHLPSRYEWDNLGQAVGGIREMDDRGNVDWRGAGEKLKARRGWKDDGNGTDAYGFSALPGGGYYGSSFDDAGDYGLWWSATEYSSGDAYHRRMHYYYDYVDEDYDDKSYGFSVRCVKDVRQFGE